MEKPRIALVLSAGGLRGVAHLGVLKQLLRHQVPIDAMVGVSAGAIIAGYYAGVGLSVDDMIRDAPGFKGRHVVMHGLTLHAPRPLKPLLRRFAGIIPQRLEQLDGGRFAPLHHGVKTLGIVCHDSRENCPVYFSSACQRGASLAQVVKASAAIPGINPGHQVLCDGRFIPLVDGGLSDSLPIAFARSLDLQATHFIVSDCRRRAPDSPEGDDVVYIRPVLDTTRTLKAPAGTLMETVGHGEGAVTLEVVERIRRWFAQAAAPISATEVAIGPA